MKKISTASFCIFIFLILYSAALAEPIWRSYSIAWEDHAPNPRFALYDSGTPGDQIDDLVLDKETGLIWTRNAYVTGAFQSWINARESCYDLELGNLKGWRLPTIEELSSLVDPSNAGPTWKSLPTDHPFLNITLGYWTSTTYESSSGAAWYVNFNTAGISFGSKDNDARVWCVQGGNGYATGNW